MQKQVTRCRTEGPSITQVISKEGVNAFRIDINTLQVVNVEKRHDTHLLRKSYNLPRQVLGRACLLLHRAATSFFRACHHDCFNTANLILSSLCLEFRNLLSRKFREGNGFQKKHGHAYLVMVLMSLTPPAINHLKHSFLLLLKDRQEFMQIQTFTYITQGLLKP